MLQSNPNPSVLTVSPSDSNFTPRTEFLRQNQHVFSSFALLAISGAGLLRLSSFSSQLVAALRQYLEHQSLLRGFREDTKLNLYEFNLDQKPWATNNTIESEKLFVHILSIIFQHDYCFLSTIDYGREHDDRLSIAFSRPMAPSQPSAHVSPANLTRTPNTVPFALSFPSATVLRVINPPLRFTPAILQSVRSAWPRGVVAEKKAAENCYEFKLKGYRWFQEDTFATDSLQHILSLLDSLDSHAFRLMTSLSLSGSRSRVKDLWIFSGSSQSQLQDSLSSSSSNVELARTVSPVAAGPLETNTTKAAISLPTTHNYTPHARGATAPGGLMTLSTPVQSVHIRAHTEPQTQRSLSPSASVPLSQSVLRKKVPTKNINPSHPLATDSSPPRVSGEGRIAPPPLASMSVSVGSVDMTGIGSLAQRGLVGPKYFGSDDMPTAASNSTSSVSAVPGPSSASPRSQPVESEGTPETMRNDDPASDPRRRTPDILYTTPHPQERHPGPEGDQYIDASDHATDSVSPSMPLPMALSMSATHSTTVTPGSGTRLSPRTTAPPPTDVPQSVCEQAQIYADAETIAKAHKDVQTPPLLDPAAFRDSAFSSNTGRSYEIPIQWTGMIGVGGKEKDSISSSSNYRVEPRKDHHLDESLLIDHVDQARARPKLDQRTSTGLQLPGAWQPTPEEEKQINCAALPVAPASPESTDEAQRYRATSAALPEFKDVDAARIASPTLSDTDGDARKSEVASLGMMSGPSTPVPIERPNNNAQKDTGKGVPSPPSGSGWVLVNIEGPPGPTEPHENKIAGEKPSIDGGAASDIQGLDSAEVLDGAKANTAVEGHETTPPLEQVSSMSPIAKVLVAADAMSPAPSQSDIPSPQSGLKRFFSRSKQHKSAPDGRATKLKTIETEEKQSRKRAGLRQKLPKWGAVEASRSGKRISID